MAIYQHHLSRRNTIWNILRALSTTSKIKQPKITMETLMLKQKSTYWMEMESSAVIWSQQERLELQKIHCPIVYARIIVKDHLKTHTIWISLNLEPFSLSNSLSRPLNWLTKRKKSKYKVTKKKNMKNLTYIAMLNWTKSVSLTSMVEENMICESCLY